MLKEEVVGREKIVCIAEQVKEKRGGVGKRQGGKRERERELCYLQLSTTIIYIIYFFPS